jgi:long-subunit acyl-CoA synthetase (AMP-forming)
MLSTIPTAANSHSYVTIPIAASARTTFISHILSTTSLTTVVVDKETLPILLSVAEGTSVKYVIVDGTPSHAELASANEKNIKLEEFKNVEAIGAAHPTSPVVPGTGFLCSFLCWLSWIDCE